MVLLESLRERTRVEIAGLWQTETPALIAALRAMLDEATEERARNSRAQ
jgi:hypothetical protein